MALHSSNPQFSTPASHNFQGTNARSWCQMIAQPSPNLSLTSLHFFLCSLFLSAFPSVFFPLLKAFLFLPAIFIFFLCCLYLFCSTKCIIFLSLLLTHCCLFCPSSSLGASCRAWTLQGSRCGGHQCAAGKQGISCPYQEQFQIRTSSA